MSGEKEPWKASSVRHTRAIQQHRSKQPMAAPSDQQIKERIQEIVHPATLAQAGESGPAAADSVEANGHSGARRGCLKNGILWRWDEWLGSCGRTGEQGFAGQHQ
jgi:hypothetical protein